MNYREMTVGDWCWRGCQMLMLLPVLLLLGFCGWTKWNAPRSLLPPEVGWDEIIAFGETTGLRDGCGFGAYHITANTKARFARGEFSEREWHPTPLRIEDDQYAFVGSNKQRITLYALHGTTCGSDKARRLKLAERFQQALRQSRNWYRVLLHGEALIVVSPTAEMAWVAYFG